MTISCRSLTARVATDTDTYEGVLATKRDGLKSPWEPCRGAQKFEENRILALKTQNFLRPAGARHTGGLALRLANLVGQRPIELAS